MNQYESVKHDVRGIQNLFRAIAKHGQNVVELYIGSSGSSAPTSIFDLNQDAYHDICVMARRLKVLKATIYCNHRRIHRLCHLDDLLSEAKELHCLAMSRDFDPFRNKVWPHLEILELGPVRVHADDLKAFTQAHKSTLRQLNLRNVRINTEVPLADVAREIGKDLRLRSVRILDINDNATENSDMSNNERRAHDLAVARLFMQWTPRTIFLDDGLTLAASPEEDENADPHTS